MNPARYLAAVLTWAILSCAHAQQAAAVAARINGAPLYTFTLDAMLRNAPEKGARPSAASMLDKLVGDRLMAAWVRGKFGPGQLHPATSVGFAREVALDDKLVGMVRSMHARELEAQLRALPGANLNSLIRQVHPLEPAVLDGLFGKPGKLRLDYALDQQQVALARQVRLLTYEIGKAGPVTLSLHDILRRQNVQGRMEFFGRNTGFMQQQARSHVAGLFVLDWATRRIGAKPLADLRQALSEQDDVAAAMALYGLAEGAESASTIQAALARKVTQAEVDAYYKAHRKLFARVERVRARHIRVASEATAKTVVAALEKGGDFAALARRHSLAPDAKNGGSLGWVLQTEDPDWLSSLVLLQPEGKVSSPFRAAVGAGQDATWEILLVEKRVEGFHPANSETVRYMARKAIANDRARIQLAAARAQARRSATIEISRAATGARGRAS